MCLKQDLSYLIFFCYLLLLILAYLFRIRLNYNYYDRKRLLIITIYNKVSAFVYEIWMGKRAILLPLFIIDLSYWYRKMMMMTKLMYKNPIDVLNAILLRMYYNINWLILLLMASNHPNKPQMLNQKLEKTNKINLLTNYFMQIVANFLRN